MDHLDEVPIDQALNLVIRAAGLSYEIVGNSILVANKSKLNEDIGVSPHVISLKYANANDISVLLANISDNITIDNSGNNLLVSASPKKINEIRNCFHNGYFKYQIWTRCNQGNWLRHEKFWM